MNTFTVKTLRTALASAVAAVTFANDYMWPGAKSVILYCY